MATVIYRTEIKYKGTVYPANKPFVVPDKDAEVFSRIGASVSLSGHYSKEEAKPVVAEVVDDVEEDKIEEPVSPLMSKTLAQLIQYAKEHNIDLGKETKKAKIVEIIEKAEK